ncbi:MAG: pinensin family lanthipeptide [Luteibaculum sp.]
MKKKKLSLNSLAVKSFVTNMDSDQDERIRGGAKQSLNPVDCMTNFSCLDYISCNPIACTTRDFICDDITINK